MKRRLVDSLRWSLVLIFILRSSVIFEIIVLHYWPDLLNIIVDGRESKGSCRIKWLSLRDGSFIYNHRWYIRNLILLWVFITTKLSLMTSIKEVILSCYSKHAATRTTGARRLPSRAAGKSAEPQLVLLEAKRGSESCPCARTSAGAAARAAQDERQCGRARAADRPPHSTRTTARLRTVTPLWTRSDAVPQATT